MPAQLDAACRSCPPERPSASQEWAGGDPSFDCSGELHGRLAVVLRLLTGPGVPADSVLKARAYPGPRRRDMNQATAATITIRTTTPAMILLVVIAVVIRGAMRANAMLIVIARV